MIPLEGSDLVDDQTPANAPSNDPAVSIIIPCRNEVDHIETFLRSVLNQEGLTEGRGFEVIVADGLSDDETRSKIDAIARGRLSGEAN